MADDGARTRILTGSPENHAATTTHGFGVIGREARRRNQAPQMQAGGGIVLYLTRVMRFAATIRVTGEIFEDRTKLRPGRPVPADPFPWRLATQPELVLDQAERVGADSPKTELEHIRTWPPEHCELAFQGQLRTVSEADAALLMERMHAAAGVEA